MTVKWEGATLQVSNSEMQAWKSCRRKWYLTYYLELGLKREHDKSVGPRQLGGRVHTALEVLYREGKDPLAVLDELYAHDIAEVKAVPYYDEETVVDLGKEQDLAKTMVQGFLEWREEEGIDSGMEFIAAESVIEVPFTAVEGVNLRGKLDQRWHRKADGAKLFRDWKTVPNLSDPQKMLPMDEQMKFYHLLEYLESLDKTGKSPQWPTTGGQYAMLRKVKRTASAKPPFYGVVEVRHNKAELHSMWLRVVKVIEEIVITRQHLDAGGPHEYHVPPRPSRDCTWACDFFAVCPLMDDGSNYEGLLGEYYAHVDPHERYQAQLEGREVTE